jgi:hypothetical protein
MHFVLFLTFRGITVNKRGETIRKQRGLTPCSAEKKSSTAVFLEQNRPDIGSILRRITARNNGRIRSEYGFKFQMGSKS